MDYVEQGYEELRLYFFQGKLNKSDITIISESQINTNRFKISFGVLAESHFVTIALGKNVFFNEVLACTTLQTNNKPTYISKNTAKITSDLNDYKYVFESHIADFSEGKPLLANLRNKRPSDNTHYLHHTFPSNSADLAAPVTEIYVTPTDTEILIESVHTYPQQNVMVFSISNISLSK